jgi:hypothetical protein
MLRLRLTVAAACMVSALGALAADATAQQASNHPCGIVHGASLPFLGKPTTVYRVWASPAALCEIARQWVPRLTHERGHYPDTFTLLHVPPGFHCISQPNPLHVSQMGMCITRSRTTFNWSVGPF